MKAIVDTAQAAHDPQNFLVAGTVRPSPEQPERISRLRAGAEAAGCRFDDAGDAGLCPIAAIHTPEYLRFLQTIHDRWQALDGAAPEVIPNIHPRARADGYPASAVGQAGYHQGDTACPIGPHTWRAAYASAQSAITAADLITAGEPAAYALCRPPGHHAYADMASGFCFLNNAAIAAERLRAAGLRPAILDVDVHHGNGTQDIFYAKSDVLTVSTHVDPSGFYPFFYGHAAERGNGAGLGYNLNLPLPMGSGDTALLDALGHGFAAIADFGADVLIVALGLYTAASDPFRAMQVTADGFTRIGAALAGPDLPTLFVQEGGYLSDDLGDNLTRVLAGFQSARSR